MTDVNNHGEREHSELAASSCYRWWQCPGSVALSRGIPNRSSKYAAEGTAAHELAELCLTSGQDAIEFIGRMIDGFEVDDEMAEAVQVYLDVVRSLTGELSVEKRVRLDVLDPPAPMFGTCDALVYDGATGTLHVVDLKYGRGKRVSAKGNPQLRYYALGAALAMEPAPVSRVVGIIVQPRVHDGISSDSYDVADLLDWTGDLLDHAKAAMQPDAELDSGDWCGFCPARGKCTKRAGDALDAAAIDFAVAVDPEATVTPMQLLLLTSAELGALGAKLDQVEKWASDVRDAIEAELKAGQDVPGWKLIEKEGREAWREDEKTIVGALVKAGVSPWQPQKLSSPAQARAKLTEFAVMSAPVKLTKKKAEEAARAALKPLLHKPRTVALVQSTDPRPALSAADHGLLAIADESNTETKE